MSRRAQVLPERARISEGRDYKLEWAESNTRLLLIKDKELEPHFKKLGAAKILDRLHEAHRDYGQVLGITSPAEITDTEVTTVRDALDELVDALRTFVVRVSGMICKRDAKSTELARQLLAPVEKRQSPAARARPAEDQPDDPTEPAPTAGAPNPTAPTSP